MSKRTYEVETETSTVMVRASNKSAAINHVARATITAKVASQDALIKHLTTGGKIIEAGSDELAASGEEAA